MDSNKYELKQGDDVYIFETKVEGNSIHLSIENPQKKEVSRKLSIEDFKALDKIFSSIQSVSEGLELLDKILKEEKVSVVEENQSIKLIFYIKSGDDVNTLEIPFDEGKATSTSLNKENIPENIDVDNTNINTNNEIPVENNNIDLNVYENNITNINYDFDTNLTTGNLESNNDITQFTENINNTNTYFDTNYQNIESPSYNYDTYNTSTEYNYTNILPTKYLPTKIINSNEDNNFNFSTTQEEYTTNNYTTENMLTKSPIILPPQTMEYSSFNTHFQNTYSYLNDTPPIRKSIQRVVQVILPKEQIPNQVKDFSSLISELKTLKKKEIGELNSLMKGFKHKSNDEENYLLKKKLEEAEKYKRQCEEEIKSLRATMKSMTSNGLESKNFTFEEKSENIHIRGSIIHSPEELELLTRKIYQKLNAYIYNKRITLNLIYKASADSDKAAAFHDKCNEANHTLVLIETDKGRRFGGYTSQNWKGICVQKKDDNAFVFSLNKMKTYDVIKGENAIGCYPKFGPVFMGCQIRIYDDAFSKEGTTFEKGVNFNTEEDFELNGGERTFNVKEIEVYEVI